MVTSIPLYKVKNKSWGSNSLPKFLVSSKISFNISTQRAITQLVLEHFTLTMYLCNFIYLLVKHLTALHQAALGLPDLPCGNYRKILGKNRFPGRHFLGLSIGQCNLLPLAKFGSPEASRTVNVILSSA